MRSLVTLLAATCFVATPVNAAVAWRGFASPVRYSSSPSDLVLVRDLDGDGHPDIITSGTHADEFSTFAILRNHGDGTFANAVSVAAGFGEELQDIADVNRDGIPDVLVSDYWSNGIAIYFGKGALQFNQRVFYATATHGGPSRFIDYDGDGIADIVSLSFGSGNQVRLHLFHGRGNGTFDPKITSDTGLANGASLSTRTIDGTVELLVSERSGQLGVIRILPNGAIVDRLDAGSGFDFACVFADVDNDGVPDVIDTTDDASVAIEPIFITIGGTQHRLRQPRHLSLPVHVLAADLDGDGNTDLITGDFRESVLYSYRGNGAGDFDEGVAFDTGGAVNDYEIADVNGDGAPDVITANSDQTVSVLLNQGRGDVSRRHAFGH